MGFTQQSLPKQSFVDSLFAEKAIQKKTISFWLDKYEENNFIIYKEQKTRPEHVKSYRAQITQTAKV